MSTFLRDQLQGLRVNRLKLRMREAWAKRQREAEAGEHPICEGCGKRHAPGIVGILQAIAGREEDEAPVPPKAH